MKVTKTNTKEIQSLHKVLNELEWLHKEMQHTLFEDVDWSDFEVLSKLGLVKDRGLDLAEDRTAEFFVEDLVQHISKIHFQRILTNLETLLDNCADPDQKTLDFNPNIKKGLELLQAWVDEDTGRKCEFPVMRVAHADLKRIGESVHSSQCPECTPGTLVMQRDPASLKLMPEDACLHCGQRFVYTDVVEGKLVVTETE
jgi:hypothetical protein